MLLRRFAAVLAAVMVGSGAAAAGVLPAQASPDHGMELHAALAGSHAYPWAPGTAPDRLTRIFRRWPVRRGCRRCGRMTCATARPPSPPRPRRAPLITSRQLRAHAPSGAP